MFLNTTRISLASGDGLVLYTDGITEAEDISGTQYGLQRLSEVSLNKWCEPVDQVRDAIISDLKRHIGDKRIADDVTLVVMRQP